MKLIYTLLILTILLLVWSAIKPFVRFTWFLEALLAKNEEEAFEKPMWLGEEVTGQIKYYNLQLSKQPYNSWKS